MDFMEWAKERKKLEAEFKRGDKFARDEIRDIQKIEKTIRKDME
jgi:hypothetical protein